MLYSKLPGLSPRFLSSKKKKRIGIMELIPGKYRVQMDFFSFLYYLSFMNLREGKRKKEGRRKCSIMVQI